MNSGPEENVKIYFPADGTYWIAAHGYYVPENQKQVFDINIRSAQGAEIKLRNLPSGPLFAGHPVQLEVAFQSLYNAKIPSTLEGVLFVGPASVPTLLEIPIRLRPTILLYPRPVMYLGSHWLQVPPQEFRLSFQNHGVQPEDAQVYISFPDGLEYQTGSAIGPGAQPMYDFPSRTLSWSGQAGAGEKIEITFQAAADPAIRQGRLLSHTRVIGVLSEQEWQLGTDVWLNQYALVSATPCAVERRCSNRVDRAAFDYCLHQVGAKAVAEVAVVTNGKDQHIGLFPGFDGANLVRTLNCCSSINRRGGYCLGWGQSQVAAGQGDDKLHAFAPGGPGVQVGGNRQQAACGQDFPRGGVMRIRQAKGRAWQRHCYRIALRQGADIGCRSGYQVVGGCCV